jgi:Heterokaryon incompatibility protein (HET)
MDLPTSSKPTNRHPSSLQPLPTHQYIRLLHLDPGPSDSSITGTLHLLDLSDESHGHYEAISYTWGPEPTTECPALPITIDGQKISIRQNLHECLLRLRKPDRVMILWNDFLCISQDDLNEKSAQVAMIGKVFREADCVRVWVGEHEWDSEMLFRGWPEDDELKRESTPMSLVKAFDRMVLRRSELSRAESKRRADVWMCFFNRRYWGRTWIVQEVYQAKKIVVHCGEDEMTWDELIGDRFEGEHHFDGISLQAVLNVPESAQLGDNIIGKIRELDANRTNTRVTPGTFADRDVLYFTQHFQKSWCSVPHDKVYGFLSMEATRYSNTDPIIVDYRISLPELLLSMYEKRVIGRHETLDLAAWKRELPEPVPLLASLRLNHKQRMEALRMTADRAATTTLEPTKQRWQHVHTQFEFAVDFLWRRDRSVQITGDENYGADLKWSDSPSEQQPIAANEETSPERNEASELVASSAKTRIARLRFKGDQYYVKIPTPFTRKNKD